jgi:two-component system CheB/CheR fusion protein
VLVVGIGASAGGFDALQALLRGVSGQAEHAYVVVFHLDAAAHDLLLRTLPKHPRLTYLPAQDGEVLKPAHVYVVPGRQLARLREGRFALAPAERAELRRAPIDVFFQSLADDQKTEAVAVVLSGLGSDGALGLKAVCDAGGMTIVQEPASAQYDAMPQSALNTGMVDHVLPPQAIGSVIDSYAAHREAGGSVQQKSLLDELLQVLPRICDVLLDESGHNFRHYKTSTLARRAMRRLQVLQLDSAQAYLARLRADPAECQRLFKDLLVSVTAFFRDPEAFAALDRLVLPALVERDSAEPIRIWVAGCATGEEAYTLGMLLAERQAQGGTPSNVQIFATDIDEHALSVARQGMYPLGIAEELSPDRLARFFLRRGDHYQVVPELRERVTFSPHNLINDPPFSRLDLVSCRNLLIYLGSHLQKKLIPLFHFALRPGGHLFLGPSENISSHRELFRPVDVRHRISQRLPTAIRSRGVLFGGNAPPTTVRPPNVGSGDDVDVYLVMQRMVLDEFAPKSLVVREDGGIVCAAGNLEKYLTVSSGAFQNNVLRLVRESLRVALRMALAESREHRRRADREAALTLPDGTTQPVTLIAQPMPQLGEEQALFLIVFRDAAASPSGTVSVAGDAAAQGLLDQLERDLQRTREDLEATLQDVEAANEELKSSNEELLSMNEELQSANEELFSSKEELQLANESLARANEDLENLLTSTQIATIFLDQEQRIRRITAAASRIYNVQPQDHGRPLADFTHLALHMPELPPPETVDGASAPIEDEITLRDGATFLRRVLPYRSATPGMAGTVVTFIDITQRKAIEQALRHSQQATEDMAGRLADQARIFDTALSSIQDYVYIFDAAGRFTYANKRLLDLWGLAPSAALGKTMRELNYAPEVERQLQSDVDTVLATGQPTVSITNYTSPTGAAGQYENVLAPVRDEKGRVVLVAGASRDLSDIRRIEIKLKESEQRFRVLADSAPVLIWVNGLEGCDYVNREYLAFLGKSLEEIQGMGWTSAVHPDDVASYLAAYQTAMGSRARFQTIVRLRRADDVYRTMQSVGLPRFSPDGSLQGYVGCSFDITDIKNAESVLVEADRRKDEFLAMLAHELRNPLAAMLSANAVASMPSAGSETIAWARQVIARQGAQLTRLVDDLLDLSRISTGKVQLKRQRVEGMEVLRRALDAMRARFADKKQDLVVDLPPAGAPLHADPARLEQIFVNVLHNACKYTNERGRIVVTAAPQKHAFVVRVRDTGIGIAKDVLPRIFDPFTQAHTSLDRAQGGLGLGLTVVKRLINEHGGEVEARSEGPGKGSEFILSFPLEQAASEAKPIASENDRTGQAKKVLVVDDNKDFTDALARLLQVAGHQVMVIDHGSKALGALKEFEPDVVMLDLGLPGINGLTVLHEIRESPLQKQPRVVIVSGYGQESDKQRSLLAGADDHLVKPVDFATIEKVLKS